MFLARRVSDRASRPSPGRAHHGMAVGERDPVGGGPGGTRKKGISPWADPLIQNRYR